MAICYTCIPVNNNNRIDVSRYAAAKSYSHVSKYIYLSHTDINLFIMKWKKYKSTIYIKLRSVNLPATLTNKRSHVAQVLVDDLIKNMKEEKFLGWIFFFRS